MSERRGRTSATRRLDTAASARRVDLGARLPVAGQHAAAAARAAHRSDRGQQRDDRKPFISWIDRLDELERTATWCADWGPPPNDPACQLPPPVSRKTMCAADRACRKRHSHPGDRWVGGVTSVTDRPHVRSGAYGTPFADGGGVKKSE